MAEVWEPGAKQTEFSLMGKGVVGFKGRAWLTDRALLEGSMAAEQRTEGLEREEAKGGTEWEGLHHAYNRRSETRGSDP